MIQHPVFLTQNMRRQLEEKLIMLLTQDGTGRYYRDKSGHRLNKFEAERLAKIGIVQLVRKENKSKRAL